MIKLVLVSLVTPLMLCSEDESNDPNQFDINTVSIIDFLSKDAEILFYFVKEFRLSIAEIRGLL